MQYPDSFEDRPLTDMTDEEVAAILTEQDKAARDILWFLKYLPREFTQTPLGRSLLNTTDQTRHLFTSILEKRLPPGMK